MGKTLTEPLLLFFIWIIVSGPILSFVKKKRRKFLLRWVPFALIWTLATPYCSSYLQRSLAITHDPAVSQPNPQLIAVLSAGYFHGMRPIEDVLTAQSAERVVVGAEWCKQNPASKLVMTGYSTRHNDRTRDHEAVLMANFATRSGGVPGDRIILEPDAASTREHPVRVLALPGVTKDTVIGVATSQWHMRRATREFKRHFNHVIPYPFLPLPALNLSARTLLPNVGSLNYSTTMLHEWIGMIWYSLLFVVPIK